MKIMNLSVGLFIICLTLFVSAASAQTPFYFGWSAVTPHAADYDGDRIQELSLYNSDDGAIYVRRLSGDELTFGLTIAESDYAVAEVDYDGDGKADLGSYDHTTGAWYAFCSRTGYQLNALQCVPGASTTEPYPADYDGDGLSDPALYDSASGVWIIYCSGSGYQAYSFILGGNGAMAVPMDYDADGKTDPCVYDQNTGLWGALCSASQYAYTWVVYGGPGCEAAPADFDGDQKADPTVYCAALGVWGTLNSASNYAPNIIIQGGPDCTPIPGNYYFTNRADYAAFNTTNGGWYIAYETPLPSGGIFGDLACNVLPSLLVGDKKGAIKGAIGWGLNLIFNHGEDPEDPRWAEMREILSEMNGKLEHLLSFSTAMLNSLNQLSRQLQYDSAKIQLLISQLLANQAFATIATRYDSGGPQGYRTFYTCDTNNPPSAQDVATFVDIVLNHTSPDLPTCITQIKNAILPTLETEEGVLRQWANMAKLRGVTPDNLSDHNQAFFAYFSTLYNYQIKAAELYVDVMRQAYTSEFQQAATYTWITNDLMNTLSAEVDEYRAVTHNLVLATINAGYNPASTNNPILVTNVSEVLSSMEFFSRQWLGQTQSLCVTFLTINPIGNTVADIKAVDAGSVEHAVQTVTTNWDKGRAYGYLPDSRNYVVVDDNYAFIRCDFGRQPCGAYTIKRGSEILGTVTVSNYDNNMRVTNSLSVTNWFGHFYAPPAVQRLTIPLDDQTWWTNWYNSVTYCPGASPSDNPVKLERIKYSRIWPNSFTNWYASLGVNVDMGYGYSLPETCGLTTWFDAFFYPIAISNNTGKAIGVRAYIAVDNAEASIMRYESEYQRIRSKYRYNLTFRWDTYGWAQFAGTDHMAKWAIWQDSKSHRCLTTDSISRYWTSCEALTYTTIPATGATTKLYVGGKISYIQDLHGDHCCITCYGIGDISFGFKLNKIQLSFY